MASPPLTAPALDRPTATGLDISPWIISSRTVTMLYPDIPPLSQRIAAEFCIRLCQSEGLFVPVQQRTEVFVYLSCFQTQRMSQTWRMAVWMFLMLLLSGNIHPNPGPELAQLENPADLKDISGLRFIHLNVPSLFNKIDLICLWAQVTECDRMVL